MVPIQVNGAELAGIRLDGQEVIAAQLLEKILGLQPKSLSSQVGREDWFVEGEDYIVLKGGRMGNYPTKGGRHYSNHLTSHNPKTHDFDRERRCVGPDLDPLQGDRHLATTLMRSNFMRRAARAVMQGNRKAFAET